MDIFLEVLDKLSSWLSLLPRISAKNIVEIAIISFLVYELLVWIKNTRAWTLLKGLLVIFAFSVVVVLFKLDTILWIIKNITAIAVTALLVVFQPELRKALEQLGSQNIITNFLPVDSSGKEGSGFNERTVNELVRATFEMAKVKTGALMVIERGTSLKEIERTGIEINGLISSQLLINIFEHNTPLHDGAVIVRENRIVAATCYLPLSDNMELSKQLGTRHRAGVGISEQTDSVTIIVSEETGQVSVAQGGKLTRSVNSAKLREILVRAQNKQVVDNSKLRHLLKGRVKHEEAKNNR